jgi:hypothetical protein
MDCTDAVKMIKEPGIDRSVFMGIVQEIKEMMADGVRFEISIISHELANFDLLSTSTMVWPQSGPIRKKKKDGKCDSKRNFKLPFDLYDVVFFFSDHMMSCLWSETNGFMFV